MRSQITSNALPASFIPTEHHIIIGRGRAVKQSAGHRRFNTMVQQIAAEYSAASCKADKGLILSQLDMVHDDLDTTSGFVKKDPVSGLWFTVEESLARTTAAQALRNYLNGEYRSSKQFKSKRRMAQLRDEQQQQEVLQLQEEHQGEQEDYSSMTRCVSPMAMAHQELTESADAQTFALLFAAFGTNTATVTNDPFSPTPMLAHHYQQHHHYQQAEAAPNVSLPAPLLKKMTMPDDNLKMALLFATPTTTTTLNARGLRRMNSVSITPSSSIENISKLLSKYNKEGSNNTNANTNSAISV